MLAGQLWLSWSQLCGWTGGESQVCKPTKSIKITESLIVNDCYADEAQGFWRPLVMRLPGCQRAAGFPSTRVADEFDSGTQLDCRVGPGKNWRFGCCPVIRDGNGFFMFFLQFSSGFQRSVLNTFEYWGLHTQFSGYSASNATFLVLECSETIGK